MKTIASKERPGFKVDFKLDVDKMKLFVDVAVTQPTPTTRAELLGIVAEVTSAEGCDLSVIDDIAKRIGLGESSTERRIRKGTPAEQGRDGKVVVLVKPFTGTPRIAVDEKGNSSFHLFDNIAPGQVVARVYHPKDGTPGVDALGGLIPAKPGKPTKVQFDAGSIEQRARPEGVYDELVAKQLGCLLDDKNKLKISSQLILPGDLDHHFGNISFVGEVVVQGSIRPGLEVRAGKSIQISGGVQRGRVISSDGSITIGEGVFGGSGSRITAKQGIKISSAQEAEIEAIGDVEVTKEVLNCDIRTGAVLRGGQAKVVGGVCHVVCGAEMKEFGNNVGITTTVMLTSRAEVSFDFARLIADQQSHEEALARFNLHLGPLVSDKSGLSRLPVEQQDRLRKLIEKRQAVLESLARIMQKISEIRANTTREAHARVNVHGVRHPGSVIVADDEHQDLCKEGKTGAHSVVYLSTEQRFEEQPIAPITCSFIPPGQEETVIEDEDQSKKGS